MYLFYGFTSLGNNLIGNNSNHFGEIASDLVNVSPQLFPLGDYGGAVPTHLTKPGSPAINAGQDTTVAPDNLTIDARSIPRKLGTAVDIGAVENAQTLTFSPTSLAAGTTGIAYNQAISAAGGSNFKVAAGKLPLGLTLSTNGVLSGTPIEAGTFDITIAAADANGYRGAISYSLLINAVAPVAGRLNALSMPGNSANQQYVTFTEAQSPKLAGYPAMTIEAWVKPTSATGRYDILNRFPIFFNIQDGKPAFYLYGLTNPGYYLANMTLPTGVWSHIAVTWDGKKVQFYINGVSSGSTDVTGAVDSTVKLPLSLGYCIECGGGGGFLGELDEIRLWKVARTQAEIQAHQWLGLTGLTALENGLEAYWRFDETSGTTVADATGHGYNGTINNLVTRVSSDQFVTNEDTAYSGTLFSYQKYRGPALTYALVTQGSKGNVTINTTTGTFTYTPNLNANGADSFTYKVNNGLDSNTATVNVNITPINDPPIIVAAAQFSLTQGSTATNVPIATVSDVDGNAAGTFPVTVTAAFPGINLTNIVNTNGTITATVAADCAARIGADPVQLTASDGSLTASAFFTVNVNSSTPVITAQPLALTRCAGAVASFTVAASGNGLTYQWRKNGVNISGATNSTFTIPAVTASDAADYSAVVTSACGTTVTSASATLTLSGTNAGTLGNYNAASAVNGGVATITPDAAPAGAVSGTTYAVTASAGFTGALNLNATTGVVNVTNAGPAGTYTVTVSATPPCGSNVVTKTFTLTVSSPAACPNPNFTGTTEVAVGTRPYSVAVGDFNSDGKLDLVSANSGSNTASIRLGDGTGNFTGTTNLAMSSATYAVVVGDFNNDGKQDIAVANYSSGAINILLGDGAGNFSQSTALLGGNGPIALAIGDFNSDGKPDLASVNRIDGTVSTWLGDGTGLFTVSVTVGVGDRPYAVALGDFNGDGKPDLAVANQISRTVSIRLGNGAGGFSGTTEISVGYSPQSIVVADFNSDGKQDFAVANYGENAVSICLGDGTGNFAAPTLVPVGTRPNSVVLSDFNNDGKLDFAAVNGDSNNVSIRFGDGAGNFSGTANVSVGTSPFAIAAGDFNGDGRPDLATANSASNNVSIRLNSCSNTAPTIAASAALSRTAASAATTGTIATVSDAETTAGGLTVTATNVPTGLTVTGITNTNGTITASVAARCNATLGVNNIELQVTDAGGMTATATLVVNVTANTPPTLSYAVAYSVNLGATQDDHADTCTR